MFELLVFGSFMFLLFSILFIHIRLRKVEGDKSFTGKIKGALDLTINKVLELPKNPMINAVYFVKNGDFCEMYITDNSGALFPVGSSEMIKKLTNFNQIKMIDNEINKAPHLHDESDLHDLKKQIMNDQQKLGIYEDKEFLGFLDYLNGSSQEKEEPKMYNAYPFRDKNTLKAICTGSGEICTCNYKCEIGLLSHEKRPVIINNDAKENVSKSAFPVKVKREKEDEEDIFICSSTHIRCDCIGVCKKGLKTRLP